MSQLTDRLERDLHEVAAGVQPSPSAWDSILARLGDQTESDVALVLAPAPNRSKRPAWLAVAAAAAVVIIGSVAVLTRAGDDQSTSTASLTTTFVSPRNGFSMKHPAGAAVTPAEQIWGYDDGFDVVDTGSGTVFKGASTGFTVPGVSMDEEIDESVSEFLPDGCSFPRSQQAEIAVDGVSGRIAECSNHIEATVVVGGRLYLFTLSHDRGDARAIFDALVATIDLTPETAVELPGLTTTFVSPTYGYSFGYFDRGGLHPATERWDPANQPLDDEHFDGTFDFVETGSGAIFVSASTPLPDGVSIDGWVDEYVTPRAAGGCGVPRNQQEEISIDGQRGRVAECDHTEATVVAGGRLYLFLVVGDRAEAAWFDAWIATMDLTPETAGVP